MGRSQAAKKPTASKPATTLAKRPAAKSAKKPAAKPAKKPAAKYANTSWVDLARTGKVDTLFGIACDSPAHCERAAYKWLCAAADFGHTKANAVIDDVMETTNMRYDDDAYEVAAAHWELGAAYLEGSDGLPLDLSLAKKHLAEAFRTHTLRDINRGCVESFDAKSLAKRLSVPARQLLTDALAGKLEPEAFDGGDEDGDD